MKKKTLSIALALTVAMGIALTGCGKEAEENKENTVTATVEEKSSETESTEVPAETESTEAETVEDYTYCNLLSDPYFDMDNAIKDEEGTALLHDALPSAADKEVFYNIIDGDKYVEISGAEIYDVNRTFTVENSIDTYPNLAYYGIDPNPLCSGVPQNRFHCISKSFTESSEGAYVIAQSDITILKAYTIPTDSNSDLPMVAGGSKHDSTTPALCEVEYNGTHYWTLDISLEEVLNE